jgi:dipeptidyl aminopeptidase/acylaminoacyl peptidase
VNSSRRGSTCGWLAVIVGYSLFVGASSGWGNAATRHLVTLDDLKNLSLVDQLQLSPDGEMLAYTVEGQPDLWLVPTRPGSVPKKVGRGTVPLWSPDSKQMAYYSQESGTLQLWAFSIATGHTEQVTHFPEGVKPDSLTCCIGLAWDDPKRYAWSPDSRRLVFPSQVVTGAASSPQPRRGDAATGEPLILTTKTPPEWTLAGIYRGGGFLAPTMVHGKEAAAAPALTTADQLFVVNVHSKEVEQLTNDDSGYFTPDWSPDGSKILCVSNDGRPLVGWGSGPTNIYVIDVATRGKTALTTDSVYKDSPSWSPDGQWISYLGARKENFGGVFLYLLPSAGGTPSNLTAKLDRRTYAPTYWSQDSNSIVINYVNGVDRPIARVSISTGAVDLISGHENAARHSLTVARSDQIAWSQGDASDASVIHLQLPGSRSSYVVLDLNPQITEWRLGTQEILHWKNGRGEDMDGVLIKPVGFERGHRYPLIVDAYPKQSNGFKGSPMSPGAAWASRGYAVFYPNADGPNTWENPWKSITNNRGAKGVQGIAVAVDGVLSGVDELIRLGIVDQDRMCLYGFSNGGAMVNQLVTRTNRFKCAISVAAALSADWSSNFFMETLSNFAPEIAGGTPWEELQVYMDLSAIYHLDKVATPILLADGDDDGPCLIGSIEMYNGLRWLGKDVTFLRYPGQAHGFTGTAMKDFWNRENTFLDKYLNPQPLASD